VDEFATTGYLRCNLVSRDGDLVVIETIDTEALDGTRRFVVPGNSRGSPEPSMSQTTVADLHASVDAANA
jgi:hypothetical protein